MVIIIISYYCYFIICSFAIIQHFKLKICQPLQFTELYINTKASETVQNHRKIKSLESCKFEDKG